MKSNAAKSSARCPTTLGDFFRVRKERGEVGLPTLSVTMNDGLVDRSDLDRKMETNLAPDEHLRVREGDIAYNMMRMWQGAFGRAAKEGLVSPAYVVVEPRENMDSHFAAHWLKSDRMLYLLWAYSYGLTKDRLRLYPDDFCQIPASPPAKPIQAKIANVLDAWDREGQMSAQLIIAKRRAYRAAVLRYTDNCREHMVEFGEMADLVTERVRPSQEMQSVELEDIEAETGRLIKTTTINPDAGQRFRYLPGDTLFGKLRPYLRKYVLASEGGVCSTEAWVLRPKASAFIPEAIFYSVQTPQFRAAAEIQAGSKMPRADWDLVAAMPVPVPREKGAQERWANYLDTIRSEISMLEARRATLRQQKRALMQRLFAEDAPLSLKAAE